MRLLKEDKKIKKIVLLILLITSFGWCTKASNFTDLIQEATTKVLRSGDVYLYKFKSEETGPVTVYAADGSFIGAYSIIQEGIDACPNGGRVICADGVYKGEKNKNLNWFGKKITVCSKNGPENCIIDCENYGRGFELINAGKCGTISGFTIRNGNTDEGGGIYCGNSSLIITNCIISLRSINKSCW
jgi:cell wall-associated NlpC family hydrolase